MGRRVGIAWQAAWSVKKPPILCHVDPWHRRVRVDGWSQPFRALETEGDQRGKCSLEMQPVSAAL